MPQWQDQLNRRLSMKKTPNFKLVTFTLLLLTGSLCVGRLTAQAVDAVSAGKFTLPFEVRGGQAILSAGHYTWTLNSATFSGVRTVRGNSKAVMILVGSVSLRPILADVSSKTNKHR